MRKLSNLLILSGTSLNFIRALSGVFIKMSFPRNAPPIWISISLLHQKINDASSGRLISLRDPFPLGEQSANYLIAIVSFFLSIVVVASGLRRRLERWINNRGPLFVARARLCKRGNEIRIHLDAGAADVCAPALSLSPPHSPSPINGITSRPLQRTRLNNPRCFARRATGASPEGISHFLN